MAKREMKTKNVEETVIEQAELVSEPKIIVEQVEPVVEEKKEDKVGSIEKGTVVGCSKLNIRKAPKVDAAVVAIVDAGETLKIVDSNKSKGDFYKVITSNKTEGFCMKKFVKIK